jgi:predicted Zn-dependent peptidase
VKTLGAVTPADVVRVAKEYLVEARRTVVVVKRPSK